MEHVDIIFGVAWGDEGKGKISARMAANYDFVCRFNGGNNAGHTFYINDQKVVTHLIPSGICFGKKSIIGSNCVLNVNEFFKEIEYLDNLGFDTSLVKVSPKAHIVTDEHIEQDKKLFHKLLGTTAKGIGPCYSSKYSRTGIRAESVLDEKWIWDEKFYGKVLCEGAQSYWLDINEGSYPYVTSSECLPYSACSLGFSPKKINEIIAVAKMYDTRSGYDPYFDLHNEETDLIIELGEEYGSTTGRKRSVKWLNFNKLYIALQKSGATKLILNKGDILEKANIFKACIDDEIVQFSSMHEMKSELCNYLSDLDVAISFDFVK